MRSAARRWPTCCVACGRRPETRREPSCFCCSPSRRPSSSRAALVWSTSTALIALLTRFVEFSTSLNEQHLQLLNLNRSGFCFRPAEPEGLRAGVHGRVAPSFFVLQLLENGEQERACRELLPRSLIWTARGGGRVPANQAASNRHAAKRDMRSRCPEWLTRLRS